MSYLGLVLAVAGCARIGGNARSAFEATRRATSAGTARPLKLIDLRYEIYLARLDIHTTITADGVLRSAHTVGKNYGPNDQIAARTEIREGRLTPRQMMDLAQLFTGWASLHDHYGGVTDGPEIRISYHGKTIAAGSDGPKKVRDIYDRVNEFTLSLPLVETKSQPAHTKNSHSG